MRAAWASGAGIVGFALVTVACDGAVLVVRNGTGGSDGTAVATPGAARGDASGPHPTGSSVPCAPVTEDCLNGNDDDCNGLIDCADPACQAGFSCIPEVESNSAYSGHYHLAQLPFASGDLGACPDGSSSTTYYDAINPAPLTCSNQGCTCSVFFPNTCNFNGFASPAPALTFFDQPGCKGKMLFNWGQTLNDSVVAKCLSEVAVPGAASVEVTSGWCAGGSCVAPGPQKSAIIDKPVPSFHRDDVCTLPSPAGGGCRDGQVCAAKPDPLHSRICVLGHGEPCPSEYPHRIDAFVGYADSRACACACEYQLGCPTGHYTLFACPDCTANCKQQDLPTGCTDAPLFVGSNTWSFSFTGGGGCPYPNCWGHGAATGAVSGTGQTTFCCLQ